jgi:hypothetical protein
MYALPAYIEKCRDKIRVHEIYMYSFSVGIIRLGFLKLVLGLIRSSYISI